MKEQKDPEIFLIGLKRDLQADSTNIESSLQFYEFNLAGFKYFEKVSREDTFNLDSLRKYGDLFFSSTELQPHVSRYEALKGNGKSDIIENRELLTNIIDFHESTLTRIGIIE
jgi:hypothetical protein